MNFYWLGYGFKTFFQQRYFIILPIVISASDLEEWVNVYMYLIDLQCVQIIKHASLFIPINISKVIFNICWAQKNAKIFVHYETGDKQNDQFQIFVKATETIPIIHISRK